MNPVTVMIDAIILFDSRRRREKESILEILEKREEAMPHSHLCLE